MDGSGKLNFMLIVVIAFLSMAVAFIVIYLVIISGPAKTAANPSKTNTKIEKKENIDPKKVVYFDISEDVVNLKSGGKSGKSLALVAVSIKLADKDLEEEFKKRKSEIKHIIRSIFNTKTSDDLENGNLDREVAKELLERIKNMFSNEKEKAKILEVFFPKCTIQ